MIKPGGVLDHVSVDFVSCDKLAVNFTIRMTE